MIIFESKKGGILLNTKREKIESLMEMLDFVRMLQNDLKKVKLSQCELLEQYFWINSPLSNNFIIGEFDKNRVRTEIGWDYLTKVIAELENFISEIEELSIQSL